MSYIADRLEKDLTSSSSFAEHGVLLSIWSFVYIYLPALTRCHPSIRARELDQGKQVSIDPFIQEATKTHHILEGRPFFSFLFFCSI